MADENYEGREAHIAGLRAAADFLEAHPEVVVASYGDYFALDIAAYGVTRDDLVAAAQASGGWDKEYSDSQFELVRSFGGGVKLSLNADRSEVCELVVVGTREVEEKVIPAHTENITEWKCGKSLLSPEEPTEAIV